MQGDEEVWARGPLDSIGLKFGSYLDRVLKRPLTLASSRTIVGINIFVAIVLIILALNHLMEMRVMSGWEYVLHLFEFGLLFSLLVMMVAAFPGKVASRQNLRNFAVLFLVYMSLILIQNFSLALNDINNPVRFLAILAIVIPLNFILTLVAFLPTLFVWTRSLKGQPAPR